MKGELETLHKSIRKRLPRRKTAACDGKGPDKQALLRLGRKRTHTGTSRALRSRKVLGRLDSILLFSLLGDFVLCEYCFTSALLACIDRNQGSWHLLTVEGKPEFNEGLNRREKKAQQLECDDEECCMARIETMCGQYIKKQSKEKEPVV